MRKTVLSMLLLLGLAVAASAQPPDNTVLLNAAGATFPYPIYSKWFNDYHQAHPNVQINYQSIGSGGGIQQLKAGTVDFGASDMPLNDQLLGQFNFKIIQFPTVLGAVVPTYNVPGVSGDLKFTAKALSDIFLGKVTKWNDSEIASSNPGVKLPSDDIVVIHRSDGSGTTFVWTDYLSKVNPDWKSKVGSNTSVNWPVGLGGKGNEGVSGLIKQTPGSIGYVELIYALQNHMGFGLVQNADGKFIKASLPSVTQAATGAAAKMKSDVRISITDASGAETYPICSFTYLLIPETISDAAKREAIKAFLNWMLTTGQGSVEALNYAQLPKAVVAIEMKHIAEIK